MKAIFYFLIFPGFLFTAIVGLFLTWVDRKVTARVQWRVGPPWYQPFADFFKLLGKEFIIPQGGSKTLFLLSPLIGLTSVVFASVIVWVSMIYPDKSFAGDLIVMLYVLTLPAISVIMGGFASRNPLASLGASREIKLMLSYELPFILSIFIPVIISHGVINMGGLYKFQQANDIFLKHPSAILGFLTAIICMQAKLTFVPYDAPEAETEIVSGAYVEYSGFGLAMYKLMRAMNFFVIPVFLVFIFCGGMKFNNLTGILLGSLKILGVVVVAVLIKNTNPRVRIDQAVKFFWGPVTAVALLAVLLAFLGI